MESSSEKIAAELERLKMRQEARRSGSMKPQSSEKIKNQDKNSIRSKDKEQKMVRRSSFGVTVTPQMVNIETQTSKFEQRPRKISKFKSMNDVRSRYDEESNFSESLTDAETVVRNSRRPQKIRKSRSRGSNLDNSHHSVNFDQPPKTDDIQILSEEIKKLRDEMAEQNQPKPVIRNSDRESSDEGQKSSSLFKKLRNEIKSLRSDLLNLATPKSRSRASSVLETDSVAESVKESNRPEPPIQNQSQNHQPPQSSFPLNNQFHQQPMPGQQMGNMTYVPFPVDPNGMPLWLLPNKTVVHAASVPNLTIIDEDRSARKNPSRQRKLEYETDSSSNYERVKVKKASRFVPHKDILIYDQNLDQKLRKVERSADSVSRRSSSLMKSARNYTYYGYY